MIVDGIHSHPNSVRVSFILLSLLYMWDPYCGCSLHTRLTLRVAFSSPMVSALFHFHLSM
jgi:hypothetical protein